jgi:hypothetical protein
MTNDFGQCLATPKVIIYKTAGLKYRQKQRNKHCNILEFPAFKRCHAQ